MNRRDLLKCFLVSPILGLDYKRIKWENKPVRVDLKPKDKQNLKKKE